MKNNIAVEMDRRLDHLTDGLLRVTGCLSDSESTLDAKRSVRDLIHRIVTYEYEADELDELVDWTCCDGPYSESHALMLGIVIEYLKQEGIVVQCSKAKNEEANETMQWFSWEDSEGYHLILAEIYSAAYEFSGYIAARRLKQAVA